jgi:serine/threonine-protein kinase
MAAAAFLAVLGVGAAFLHQLVERRDESARTRARELGTAQVHDLEKRLDLLFASSSALAAVLRQDVDGFAAVAAGVLDGSPGLSALVFVPAGGPPVVHPPGAEEGEAEWLTTTPASPDSRPVGRHLEGPTRLPSGDLVVFGVIAVDAGDGTGQVAAALRVSELVRGSALAELRQAGFDYELAGVDPGSGRQRVLDRSTELALADPMSFPIAVPGGGWTLALAPGDGWPTWASLRLPMALTAILAFIAGVTAHEVAQQPERLRAQVDRRSTSLRRTKHRLNAEIRQRAQAEARAAWQELDRFARLAFVAAGRPRDPEGASENALVVAVGEALDAVGSEYRTEEIRAGVARLEEKGLLERDAVGVMRVARPLLLSLPEAGRPLTELAREGLEKVGPYRLARRIGGGGMGEVFSAEHVETCSRVAVKLLHPHALDDQEQRQRFEREGELVSRLDHPNIVRLLDRGEHQGRLFIAMELVEGQTVESMLEERGVLSSTEALTILRDVAGALGALHELGVVHRDVKSSNVMRTGGGRTVLLDFGLASRMASQGLTRSDTILGTVPYMAPERLRGDRGTPRVDVWAAGLLLYEMLLGRLPWKNPNDLSLVNEILSSQSLPIAARIQPVAGAAPARLAADMLAYQPRDRPADGAALLARVAEVMGDSPAADGRGRSTTPPTAPVARPAGE